MGCYIGTPAGAEYRQSAKLFFCILNWDFTTPSAAGECAPHPLVRGEGHTR